MTITVKKKKASSQSGGKKKFESRSQRVLEETYKKREERSTSGGRSIFKDGALPEYKPKQGAKEAEPNQIFIGAQGFAADTGIHFDAAVHYGVGPALDAFLCRQIMMKEICPRCEDLNIQSREWRAAGGKKGEFPDNLTAMFPWDRALYLVVDMTSASTMEVGWQLWNAPKGAVHSAIIARTHNKRTGEFVDITDFTHGRIVTFDMGTRKTKRGNFPEYLNFDLYKLEEPIPDYLQEALVEIVEQGEKNGGTVQQYLHWPSYEEVHRSHYAGVDRKDIPKSSLVTPSTEEEAADEDSVRAELQDMNKIQLKRWARERGIEVNVAGKTEDVIIEEILGAMVEETDTAEEPSDDDDSPPDCFGEAYDHDECKDCDWLEEECILETEKRVGDE